MTFQVGMKGNNGVLLASDRLYTHKGGLVGGVDDFEGDKIFISQDEQVAYCATGGDLADRVGIQLLTASRKGIDVARNSVES
jgi:20S proteasome alpha/beta subunit